MQQALFDYTPSVSLSPPIRPFKSQLLKWIGNKQRFAHEIVGYFPQDFGCYYEPFLGSGAVLATLAPHQAVASDINPSLIEIWRTLHDDPDQLKEWYKEHWLAMNAGNKVTEYERVKASYNMAANGKDLLFLCRTCYGGVVRFRKSDGYMSTPCGPHDPISPESFADRVGEWHRRTLGAEFRCFSYEEAMTLAKPGDMIYCDPPYSHSQGILYKAQSFSLKRLLETIGENKRNGVYVALSIDGTKRSGNMLCDLPIPKGLFEREVFVNCGRSMLKRFQMGGRTLEGESITDRLLLTY